MACLQSEVGTKDFFRGTNFLTENAPKFSPKFLKPLFVGQKNPQNSRQISCKNSLPKIKRKSPTSFCRSAGRKRFDQVRYKKNSRNSSIFIRSVTRNPRKADIGIWSRRRIWTEIPCTFPHKISVDVSSSIISPALLCQSIPAFPWLNLAFFVIIALQHKLYAHKTPHLKWSFGVWRQLPLNSLISPSSAPGIPLNSLKMPQEFLNFP